MGKSAKLHKRVPKKTKSSSTLNSAATTTVPSTQSQIQTAKKRANLKEKTSKSRNSSAKDGVLGGADYVALMMGSRKMARQEAQKLPQ